MMVINVSHTIEKRSEFEDFLDVLVRQDTLIFG